ncbi:MAG TPA: hypothetical protein VFZ68_15275 [Acidimicrobiales bacterium]
MTDAGRPESPEGARRPRPAPPARPPRPGTRTQLRRALATPGSVRLAFLVREVLGPPVSLRGRVPDRPS